MFGVRQRRKTAAKREQLLIAEIRLDVRTVEGRHLTAVPAYVFADARNGTSLVPKSPTTGTIKFFSCCALMNRKASSLAR